MKNLSRLTEKALPLWKKIKTNYLRAITFSYNFLTNGKYRQLEHETAILENQSRDYERDLEKKVQELKASNLKITSLEKQRDKLKEENKVNEIEISRLEQLSQDARNTAEQQKASQASTLREHFASLVRAQPEKGLIMGVINPQGKITDASPAFYQFSKYAPDTGVDSREIITKEKGFFSFSNPNPQFRVNVAIKSRKDKYTQKQMTMGIFPQYVRAVGGQDKLACTYFYMLPVGTLQKTAEVLFGKKPKIPEKIKEIIKETKPLPPELKPV